LSLDESSPDAWIEDGIDAIPLESLAVISHRLAIATLYRCHVANPKTGKTTNNPRKNGIIDRNVSPPIKAPQRSIG
jgi:hypothetical protein